MLKNSPDMSSPPPQRDIESYSDIKRRRFRRQFIFTTCDPDIMPSWEEVRHGDDFLSVPPDLESTQAR